MKGEKEIFHICFIGYRSSLRKLRKSTGFDNCHANLCASRNGYCRRSHPSDAIGQSRVQGSGVVTEIMAKIGDQVKKGDVLMKLDNYDQANAQMTSAQLELTSAQQAFDALNRDASGSQAQLWEAYMNAQVVRENAQKKWDGLNLHDIEIHISDAQATLVTRKSDLADAQANFDQYQNLDPNSGRYKTAQDRLRSKQKAYDEAVTNFRV